eukprot:sb/3468067/
MCGISAVLWGILPQVTVFQVGMLSVCRLAILQKFQRRLTPLYGWLLPVMCTCTLITVYVVLISSGAVHVEYSPDKFSCFMSVSPVGNFSELIVEESYLVKGLCLVFVPLSFVPAMAILPIICSLLLTLRTLQQTKCAAAIMVVSKQKHKKAAITAILVTFTYVVFNLPYALGIMAAMWSFMKNLGAIRKEEITFEEYWARYATTGSVILDTYVLAMLSTMLIQWNSAMNPIIYLTRMEGVKLDLVKAAKRVRCRIQIQPNHISHQDGGGEVGSC